MAVAFEELEREIFRLLEEIKKITDKPVLVGGYALNAYLALPRFSLDCDLVLFEKVDEIMSLLKKEGYEEKVSREDFIRLEKRINAAKAGFDLLIGKVIDRISGVGFDGKDVFENSGTLTLPAKSDPKLKIRFRIANPEFLFIAKTLSSRKQDVRDVFMLSSLPLNIEAMKDIVEKYGLKEILKERTSKMKGIVETKTFRNSLHGVYGRLPNEFFEGCKKGLFETIKKI